MNLALWCLQIVLALHTAMGAVWKIGNPETKVPSLSAIPHPVWAALIGVELLVAAVLLLPLWQGTAGSLAPVAALVIAAEMAAFILVHMASGKGDAGQPIYWGVVLFLCLLLAAGRLWIAPL